MLWHCNFYTLAQSVDEIYLIFFLFFSLFFESQEDVCFVGGDDDGGGDSRSLSYSHTDWSRRNFFCFVPKNANNW